jgi:Rab GDP dissociation inhibitor
MGIFEKRRFRNFLIWVNQFKAEDPNTYQGMRRGGKRCLKDVYGGYYA